MSHIDEHIEENVSEIGTQARIFCRTTTCRALIRMDVPANTPFAIHWTCPLCKMHNYFETEES
ncbi:MAG: hypothetical protein ACE5FA_00400 [Dehalococcoidia bacterium]